MGAILLTASHNPGGPTEDFGIKFNAPNGGPALESLTNLIYEKSKTIQTYSRVDLPLVNINEIQSLSFDLNNQTSFKVSIVDPCSQYIDLMKELFDFDKLRRLI
jgi:phosphoglucomutase